MALPIRQNRPSFPGRCHLPALRLHNLRTRHSTHNAKNRHTLTNDSSNKLRLPRGTNRHHTRANMIAPRDRISPSHRGEDTLDSAVVLHSTCKLTSTGVRSLSYENLSDSRSIFGSIAVECTGTCDLCTTLIMSSNTFEDLICTDGIASKIDKDIPPRK